MIITSAVEQLTLVFKQAAALGLKKQFITTGGSQNRTSSSTRPAHPWNGTMHLTTFCAVGARMSRRIRVATRAFIAEWKKRGYQFRRRHRELPRL